ncbi:hypothetical protein PCANC_00216 [Puccinia coronata f. sp. avenae]|uniref:PUM-HD domain-containing protein n=1 Tax=Puccinia coronata f. sp. avenae TaxID=200324 RepID=A0A2N5W9A5_9BASI|nr:hypothetical protein PCANC_00216 [Puccinia coronata f. sp. avenae]
MTCSFELFAEQVIDLLSKLFAEQVIDLLSELFAEKVIDLLSELFAEQVIDLLSEDLAEQVIDLLSEDLAEQVIDLLSEDLAEQATSQLFASRLLACSAKISPSRPPVSSLRAGYWPAQQRSRRAGQRSALCKQVIGLLAKLLEEQAISLLGEELAKQVQ